MENKGLYFGEQCVGTGILAIALSITCLGANYPANAATLSQPPSPLYGPTTDYFLGQEETSPSPPGLRHLGEEYYGEEDANKYAPELNPFSPDNYYQYSPRHSYPPGLDHSRGPVNGFPGPRISRKQARGLAGR